MTISLFRKPLACVLLWAALLFVAAGVHAQAASPGEGLLPVTQAFALKATIDKPGAVALHFDIAPHYYLYRGRIHAKILTSGVTTGTLQTPAGTREHDPYLGDVEIYHDAVDASLPYAAAGAVPATLKLEVEYQGCHEVAPKICYPPNTETFILPTSGGGPVGAAVGAAADGGAPRNPLTTALTAAPGTQTPAGDQAAAQSASPIGTGLAIRIGPARRRVIIESAAGTINLFVRSEQLARAESFVAEVRRRLYSVG